MKKVILILRSLFNFIGVKAQNVFLTNIRDNFMKNLDLLSISKLVASQ